MADTIKEMLVSLGFDVQADQQKKFLDALNSISASAEKLSASVAGAATATVHAVQEMSDSLEQLFYSSQRAGTSAAELQAMSFGFQQIGLGAHSAKEALAAFNLAMVSNPGTEALFTALTGKSTRDAAGRMRDTKAMYRELSRELDKQPEFIAIQRAGQFGLDPTTYLQQRRNRPQEEAAEARLELIQQRLGVSTQQATVRATQWNTALRDLWGVFDTLGIKIKEDMQGKSLPALTAVHDYIMNHLPSIRTVLDKVEVGLDSFAAAAIASGKRVYNSFANDEKFQGDLKRLEASFGRVGRTINDAIGKKDGKGLWEQFEEDLERGIKDSTVSLTHFNDGLVTVIKAAKDAIKGDWAAAWEEFGAKPGTFKDKWTEFVHSMQDINPDLTSALSSAFPDTMKAIDALQERVDQFSDWLRSTTVGKWITGGVSAVGNSITGMFSGQVDSTLGPGMRAVLDSIIRPESSGNPNAQNPKSSAHGLLQMTDGTWKEAESGTGRHYDHNNPADQIAAGAYIAAKTYMAKTGRNLNDDALNPINATRIATALHDRWTSLPGGKEQTVSESRWLRDMHDNLQRNLAPVSSAANDRAPSDPQGGSRSFHQTNNITNKVDASNHKDPHAVGESVMRVLPRANAQLARDLGSQVVGPPAPAFGGT